LTSNGAMASFDEDTALVETGERSFRGTVSPRWFVGRGPNGGLLAAQAVRAMQNLVADPGRVPLSLTVHFLRAPAAGTIEIAGAVERTGRSTTTVSLRIEQEGRTVALALGVLAVWRDSVRDHLSLAPPRIAPPGDLEPVSPELLGELPAFIQNYEWRWAVPEAAAGEARVGGWIRTRDDRPIDHISVAAFADAFPPAVFTLLGGLPASAPTIDLTIHFRAPLGGSGWVLGSFRSGRVAGGYFEEDGELWGEDGTLLAQSRQLAILREPEG